MNWIDFIVIGLTIVLLAAGYYSGLVFQMAGILSFVLATLFSILLGPVTGKFLSQWITSDLIASMVAYSLIFFAVNLFVRLMALAISKTLEKKEMKHIDRALGGMMGTSKALLISAAVISVMSYHGTDGMKSLIDNSLIGPRIVYVINYGIDNAEKYGVREKVYETAERVKEATAKAVLTGKKIAEYGDKAPAPEEPQKNDTTPTPTPDTEQNGVYPANAGE